MINIDTKSVANGLESIKPRLNIVDKAIIDVAISTLEKCGDIIERLNEEIHNDDQFLDDGWGFDENDTHTIKTGEIVKQRLQVLARIAYGKQDKAEN